MSKVFTVEPISGVSIAPAARNDIRNEKRKDKTKFFNARIFSNNGWNIQVQMQPKQAKEEVWYPTEALYGPLTLIIVISGSFSVTLLPVRNVLTDPQYWYEILSSTLSSYFFLAFGTAIEVFALLKDDINKGIMRIAIEFFVLLKFAESLAICFMHLIWSEILGYY